MVFTLVVVALTIILMIASIIFFPTLTIKRVKFSPYWIIALLGVIVLLFGGVLGPDELVTGLFGQSLINPVKILTLFLSFTVFSIFLDEIGFFAYMASLVAMKAKNSQPTLFLAFYLLTAVLTVFTANDIVILTLTPFIIYFAKNAKINPLPYLVSEFVAANTWSMLLIIGNPTNIYLATSFGIDFLAYFVKMLIPTLSVGVISYLMMRWLFHRFLKTPLSIGSALPAPDRGMMVIGLTHLGISTILISIASYIGLEMWIITLSGSVSLMVVTIVYRLVKRQSLRVLLGVFKRIPYSLIPFMLSMTALVVAVDKFGLAASLARSLSEISPLFSYGFVSFFFSNLINNIPMTILFREVLAVDATLRLPAVYATIIGSNLGAILSPIGALAGIMWMSILKREGIRYGYGSFLRYGFIISLPLMLISLLGLSLLF
ncbi:MAG: SLC13 family permease [Bacilli bacterium]|jgi:arsenical pump membrane protein